MASSSSSSPPEWDQLLAASQKNLPDTIRTLVSEGVDPNHANQVGQSALHIAAIWAHVESLQVLLELGANRNATNAITGATPLHCAVQSSKATSADRRILTVQTLLDAGADPSRGDFYGAIPFDYCEDDDVDVKDLLQPEIPPIFEAIQNMDMERLAALLLNDNDAAAAVVQSRHAGMTPLLQLVDDMLEEDKDNGDDSKEKGEVRLEMMRLLLENGADPNAIPAVKRNGHLTVQQKDDDPGNDPPLSKICVQLGNAYCRAGEAADDDDRIIIIDRLQRAARLLLSKNDAVVVSASTQQLLHNAARRNQVGMMQFWIGDLKVSPNVRGRQGMTPLQFAARSGQTEAVEFLLSQHDIDTTIRDDLGQTALDAARLNNKNDIVALLEQHTQ